MSFHIDCQEERDAQPREERRRISSNGNDAITKKSENVYISEMCDTNLN